MSKLGVETNPGVTKVAVETKLSKLGDETNPRPKLKRFWVETKFNKLGVETNPGVTRVAVDTKFRRLGVETRLRRFGVEMKRRIVEANS